MTRWVGLLRGVNVGKRRLAMADVRACLESLGCTDVTTYVQSGNLVWTSSKAVAATVQPALEKVAGFDIPTVLLTAAEYLAAAADNPWSDHDDTKAVHVFFLGTPLAAQERERVAALTGRDDIALGDTAVYLHLNGGFHDSTQAAAIFRAIPQATARNLATTRAVAALVE